MPQGDQNETHSNPFKEILDLSSCGKKKENVFCYKLKQLETFYELAILNFILIGLAGQRCSTTDSVGTNNPAAKSDDLDTDTGETDIVLSSMYSY